MAETVKSEDVRTRTPWGIADLVYRHGRGINFYSTPGHGGFKVSFKLNLTIPKHLRRDDGWYEEDCDYARVIIAFPDRFTLEEQAQALITLRNWAPEAYEAHTGLTLQPGESYMLDVREGRR